MRATRYFAAVDSHTPGGRTVAARLQQPPGQRQRPAAGAAGPSSCNRSRASPRSRRRRETRRIAELVNLALEGVCAGAAGWVSGVANVFPAESECLWELCRAGDLADARTLYAELLPLARLDMTPTRPAGHDAQARPVPQGRPG